MVTLKERMASSKCWTHRRNLLQLHEYLHRNCSWEMMESIPPLPMTIFTAEKVLGIKLEHCRVIASIL